ncbi:MFS transporter, partial [Lactobacillus salivarius]|nr:MFS transporter [Ligilactobacillus salivarius]
MARNIADTINPKTRLAVSIILLLSTFISLMSQTMMITALPVIQNQMNQSLTTVQWLTTGYTLLIGIVTPLSSNMYDKFSNRSVFLGTIGTFVIGTLIGCLATNFWLLLLARLVQACAGGILMSFQMTTMISIYPPEKRGTIIGMSGLVIAFGPAIGPTLAGFILNLLGWRYLFILILPIMVLIWIIGYFVFPNYSEPLDIKIDYLSVVLSLLGSSLALIGITIVQTQWILGLAMLVVGAIIL